ncbi:MAG: hypothetical protein Fur0026_06220 [Sideroxydans sp.]
MDELDAIQTSLASFTQRLDEVAQNQFNEIRKCSFFDPIPSAVLQSIARSTSIKTFKNAEKITTEGDEINAFYVILFGKASVQVRNQEVAVLHSGECIGEAAFFAAEATSRSATVIAEGEVIAAVIRKADIKSLSGENMNYMDKALMNALFRKLQQANRKIEELLR